MTYIQLRQWLIHLLLFRSRWTVMSWNKIRYWRNSSSNLGIDCQLQLSNMSRCSLVCTVVLFDWRYCRSYPLVFLELQVNRRKNKNQSINPSMPSIQIFQQNNTHFSDHLYRGCLPMGLGGCLNTPSFTTPLFHTTPLSPTTSPSPHLLSPHSPFNTSPCGQTNTY